MPLYNVLFKADPESELEYAWCETVFAPDAFAAHVLGARVVHNFFGDASWPTIIDGMAHSVVELCSDQTQCHGQGKAWKVYTFESFAEELKEQGEELCV